MALQEQGESGAGPRIRTLLEMEAFTEIHKHWKRAGLPVRRAGAVVRDRDRRLGRPPAALAELMGIIVNGGVRLPTRRIEELHFAAGTPYETLMRRDAQRRSA